MKESFFSWICGKGGINDEFEFSDRPSSELDVAGFFPDMYFAEKLTPSDFSLPWPWMKVRLGVQKSCNEANEVI